MFFQTFSFNVTNNATRQWEQFLKPHFAQVKHNIYRRYMGRDSCSIKQIKQSVKRKGNKTTGSDIINKTKKKRKLNNERVKSK